MYLIELTVTHLFAKVIYEIVRCHLKTLLSKANETGLILLQRYAILNSLEDIAKLLA